MKQARTVKSLSTLVTLKEREVDTLMADLAAKQVMRERFQTNLARMENLCNSQPLSGATSPVQALNSASFKVAVMQMADLHRQDLALHEADMAVSQRALNSAAQRREVLEQVLSQHQRSLSKAQASREQKGQDDLAIQVWLRRQS